MWQPSCTIDMLKARSELYAQLRAFFMARNVMEVETPMLSRSTATDPQLASVPVELRLNLPDTPATYYLHTSPEFPMKRLLAAGSGCIYQICKTFRDGETGHRHNPEFTMLEWYRVGFGLQQLMDEVAALVSEVCGTNATEVLTYEEAFERYLNLNPFSASNEMLAQKASDIAGYDGEELSRDDYLNMLLAIAIEPKLGVTKPTFLTEYPASQASLAKLKSNPQGIDVAERFELYINGLEIANGYHELTDPKEQEQRFDQDNHERQAQALPKIPKDQHLLQALRESMPACSGVALGLDRLLMVQQGKSCIQDVLGFAIERA